MADAAYLHGFHDSVTVHLQVLFALERLLDGDLDDAALLGGDDAVAAALGKGTNGVIAHTGGGFAVARVGGAAALDMAEDGYARLHADGIVDLFADVHRAAGAFGHDDHEVGVAGEAGILNALDNVLLEVDRVLGHEDGRGTDGDADVQRQEACVSAHDLDHGAALVGLHGVAQLVDALDGGVAGGVEADGVVGAAHVVIDGGGDAHHRDAEAGELERTAEGTVAPDGDDALQAEHFAGGDRFFAAFFGQKVLTAGGIEDGAAAGERMADADAVELDKIAVDEALETAADADAFHVAVDSRADDRTHCRVHAGGVTAAGEHADSLDFFHWLYLQ